MSRENMSQSYIMPENSQRTRGSDAQRLNIAAAKLVGELVRTTLGPKGMDKMLVDSMGDVIVTNDGVTILREMQIEHPAAKMIVEIAKTQEEEVGDGTTTAVVIAGELLKQAESLLDKNIHPTVIAKGYRLAEARCREIIDEITEKVDIGDHNILLKVAMTSMTGKGAESSKENLAKITVKAINMVSEKAGSDEKFRLHVNKENIKIEKKMGGRVEDSELVKGIILDKEKVHSQMPSQINKAKIALIDCPLEVRSLESDAKLSINDPSQMQAFFDMEEKMLVDMVEKISESSANVVICQKGIDEMVQHLLAKKGVYAVRRVKRSDMEKLARATGGNIISKVSDLRKEDLGFAGNVSEKMVGDEEMTYVQDCKNPKAVTILLRGGTEHVVDEIKRAVEDAIGDLATVIKTQGVIAGAGSVEIELSRRLSAYGETLRGREQIAVKSFAEALEIIPKTLAENSGLDPIDVLANLKSSRDPAGQKSSNESSSKSSKEASKESSTKISDKRSKDQSAQEKKSVPESRWKGLDVFTGKVIDAWNKGIIEPVMIKKQAISSACDVATMILRIDDVIYAGPSTERNENKQLKESQEM